MAFSPTDHLSLNVTLQSGDQSYSFDCLEAKYQARMHGAFTIQALVVGDVDSYAFEAPGSKIQLGLWSKVVIQSERFNHFYIFEGKVHRITGTSKFANGKELILIECVPECYELFNNRRSGVYYGGSVVDVIDRGVIKRFQALNYQQTKVSQSLAQATTAYPIQNSITQFGESDFAFILRNLSEYGIWANFRQDFSGKAGLNLQIADHNGALNQYGTVEILTKTDHKAAGLYDVNFEQSHTVDTVNAIYFDESQNQYIIRKADVPTPGEESGEALDHHCLGNQLTEAQVEAIAGIVKDSFALEESVLTANFQGLNVQPGDVINVTFGNQTTPYLITQINYEFAKGDQERSQSAVFSQNHQLTAQALLDYTGQDLTYRAPIWLKQEQGFMREYPNCDYKGVLSGCYGMPTGEIVVPYSLGNIPVMFPYNYTEVCGKVPARFTRVISLSNEGGTTGRTFPVYQDTELQVMFANGNMDYPLIKGAAANAATGHVHNAVVQNRTHYALPQGQYLTYSNVPGDHNFVAMGASHQEGAARTQIMLSNHQDPNLPGAKKLDSQMLTTHSMERSVAGDTKIMHVGNGNVIDGQTKGLPVTKIQFVIGDQTNIQNPTVAPMLDDYLQGISGEITLTINDKSQAQPTTATNLQKNLYVLTTTLSQTVDPSVSVNVSQVEIQLTHNGRNGTDTTLAVNIIAQNTKPTFPTDTITLQPSDWQANKSTDDYGNVIYTVNLNLLAPAFLFNFRQDFYEWKKAEISTEDLAVYQALKPYFTEESYTGNPVLKEAFTGSELNFFKTMGDNVTLFIHGYSVGSGAWPVNYIALAPTTPDPSSGLKPLTVSALVSSGSANLYQDDAYMQTKYGSLYNPTSMFSNQNGGVDNTAKFTALVGTDAHKWLLAMENSLNTAAGFDGKDYSKYTRLIGINWQGNPTSAADYMAATGTTIFPAEKAFALIQQLHGQGLKINVVAHSLGNDVLMHLLDLCGAAGIQIDHAFMWDAAIPNSAFDDNTNKKHLDLQLFNPVAQNMQEISYWYNYPNAQKGVSKVTVLYSEQDTVLGAIPPGDKVLTVMQESDTDPGAGAAIAGVAGGMDFGGDLTKILGVKRPLNSIYYIANLFVYPLSYFTLGTEQALENYYQLWLNTFGDMPNSPPQWQDDNGGSQGFASSLATQRSIMASKYPELFNLISQACRVADSNTLSVNATYDDISEKEKVTASVLSALKIIPSIEGFFAGAVAGGATGVVTGADVAGASGAIAGGAAGEVAGGAAGAEAVAGNSLFVTGDSATPQEEHAKDVATIILSGLLCTTVQPDQALGYKGIPEEEKPAFVLQTGQTKPGTAPTALDHYLCVDHNAMLFPTPDFMKYIYKGVLMAGQTISFQQFGKWPI